MSFRLEGLGAAVLLAVGVVAASGQSPELANAQKMFRRTNYSGVIELLKPTAASDASSASLVGQSYLMLGEPGKAVEYLNRSVSLDPQCATCYLWLGRAYGRKAELDFPLNAPHDASKARANLEKALELDPNSSEATDDLFEYYLQAPGFLGGGFDKAARMAEKIAQRDPAEGEFAKARLAEARKDYSTAEALLRRALELAPKQPRRLLDLAVFLAKRGRYDESDAAFLEARKYATQAPRVLYREASTYIRYNRKPEEARQLLQQYLASSNLGPDDPSKNEARQLLRKLSGS
jgi:tetratricopeptide (TPR) repeat protein